LELILELPFREALLSAGRPLSAVARLKMTPDLIVGKWYKSYASRQVTALGPIPAKTTTTTMGKMDFEKDRIVVYRR